MNDAFIRRRKFGQRHREWERRTPFEDTETYTGKNTKKPRVSSNHCRVGRGRQECSVEALRANTTLPPPSFWTTSLQNSERIN